jgi:hypothetical protein
LAFNIVFCLSNLSLSILISMVIPIHLGVHQRDAI